MQRLTAFIHDCFNRRGAAASGGSKDLAVEVGEAKEAKEAKEIAVGPASLRIRIPRTISCEDCTDIKCIPTDIVKTPVWKCDGCSSHGKHND
jgi:hypothetical protein